METELNAEQLSIKHNVSVSLVCRVIPMSDVLMLSVSTMMTVVKIKFAILPL